MKFLSIEIMLEIFVQSFIRVANGPKGQLNINLLILKKIDHASISIDGIPRSSESFSENKMSRYDERFLLHYIFIFSNKANKDGEIYIIYVKYASIQIMYINEYIESNIFEKMKEANV